MIISKVLALLKLEPAVQDLHKEALSFAEIPAGKRFRAYKRQARLRNLLPHFETGFDIADGRLSSYQIDNADSFDPGDSSLKSTIDDSSLSRDNNEFDFGMQLRWSLDNLIYDPEVIDIHNSARITANIRENLLTEITQIYFSRKKTARKLTCKFTATKLRKHFKVPGAYCSDRC